ncbi:hypothetical protein D9M68_925020 [compost metagenome]
MLRIPRTLLRDSPMKLSQAWLTERRRPSVSVMQMGNGLHSSTWLVRASCSCRLCWAASRAVTSTALPAKPRN